jgi:hypothetical protein
LVESKVIFSVEEFENYCQDILIRNVKIFIEIDANLPLEQVMDKVDYEMNYLMKPKISFAVVAHRLLLGGITHLLKESTKVFKEYMPNKFTSYFSTLMNFFVIPVIKENLE